MNWRLQAKISRYLEKAKSRSNHNKSIGSEYNDARTTLSLHHKMLDRISKLAQLPKNPCWTWSPAILHSVECKTKNFTVCFSGLKLLFHWSHLSWISRQICCGTLELVLESNPHTSADYRLIPITSRIQTKMKGSKQSIGVWEMFDVWL